VVTVRRDVAGTVVVVCDVDRAGDPFVAVAGATPVVVVTPFVTPLDPAVVFGDVVVVETLDADESAA
jgi:hypothetical protein